MENALIILFGLTMLYLSAKSRIKGHINILAFQGFLLFSICYFDFHKADLTNSIFLFIETFIVKTIVIPLFLLKIVNQNKIYRDTEPYIPNFYSLVVASVILFSGFLVSSIHSEIFETINPLYFGVSISVIIISLFLITVRHKVITNIIGFIAMENGIFLLTLSIAKEMPLIVNLGILLDVFIAVFILGLLVNQINSVFKDLSTNKLCDLKDCECND